MSETDAMMAIPWVALALAALSLAIAVMRWSQARQAALRLVLKMEGANRSGLDYGEIKADLSGLQGRLKLLQDNLARVGAGQSASALTADGEMGEEEELRYGPMEQFLDLVRSWEHYTRQKLQGAAVTDKQTIDSLTEFGRRAESADAAVFIAAARRVVEYAVRASGVRAESDAEELGRVLKEMAGLAEIRLIEPQLGQRYEPDCHEVVDKVMTGAGNRRETIAKVEVRGLVRKDGSVMKAKVYLYD